jgi:hypothetical protein
LILNFYFDIIIVYNLEVVMVNKVPAATGMMGLAYGLVRLLQNNNQPQSQTRINQEIQRTAGPLLDNAAQLNHALTEANLKHQREMDEIKAMLAAANGKCLGQGAPPKPN